MTARPRLILLFTTLGAAILSVLWLTGDDKQRTVTPETTRTETPSEEKMRGTPEPTSEQVSQPDSPSKEPATADLSDEQIERRQRLEAMQEAAQKRFSQTVEMDNLDPQDIDPAVRSLFRGARLRPAFDVDGGQTGRVAGLRINGLSENNPLAEAGFGVGDRLVSINGQPLRDPAEIAHLMTRLKGQANVCAADESGQRCRTIELD